MRYNFICQNAMLLDLTKRIMQNIEDSERKKGIFENKKNK
jgi:hypothetical protein